MFKSIASSIILVLILFLASCQNASLNKFIKSSSELEPLQYGHLGISIRELSNGEEIFTWQNKKLFTPASNIKILTLYSSLLVFNDSLPSFLAGADVIFPLGDPTLFHDSFLFGDVFEKVKNRDTLRVQFLDPAPDAFGSGWAWDDFSYYYQAEISQLPIYGNVVSYSFDSTFQWRRPPHCIHKRSVNKWEREVSKNIFYPSKKEGITPFIWSRELALEELSGKNSWIIDSSSVVNFYDTIYNVNLDTVLRYMMKNSDNHVAEQLLLNSAIYKYKLTDIDTVIEWMKEEHLPDLPMRWVDGSGLSRYNLLSPSLVTETLYHMQKQLSLQKILYYFPQIGKNNHAESFTTNDNYPVRAKTGTLSNNHCLSGFIRTESGQWLAFSLMYNHYPGNSQAARKFFRNLLNRVKNRW